MACDKPQPRGPTTFQAEEATRGEDAPAAANRICAKFLIRSKGNIPHGQERHKEQDRYGRWKVSAGRDTATGDFRLMLQGVKIQICKYICHAESLPYARSSLNYDSMA